MNGRSDAVSARPAGIVRQRHQWTDATQCARRCPRHSRRSRNAEDAEIAERRQERNWVVAFLFLPRRPQRSVRFKLPSRRQRSKTCTTLLVVSVVDINTVIDVAAGVAGEGVDLKCRVVSLANGRSFLCQDSEAFHAGRRVLLEDCGKLSHILCSFLPPFVGTEVTHVEDISISGVVVFDGINVVLTNLQKCRIQTRFGDFDIPLDVDHAPEQIIPLSFVVFPDGDVTVQPPLT